MLLFQLAAAHLQPRSLSQLRDKVFSSIFSEEIFLCLSDSSGDSVPLFPVISLNLCEVGKTICSVEIDGKLSFLLI